MLTLVGCLVVLLFAALLFYALYQRRDVKAGLKIPFAAFFFEATDRKDDSQMTTTKRTSPD
jgi:hypothetical protein